MPTASGPPSSAELISGIGFRMIDEIERVPAELVRELGAFPTPDISDQMNRLYAMNSSIRPFCDPQLRLVGPACTVKVFPGDNLMVHKSLDIARPGDVVVVDASSSTTNAVLGDTISMKARHRGIAGFVIDGLVRDVPAIRELGDFPVFARGITPIGPLHRGPGEINFPISVGGIVVNPGDLIVADECGVVLVPRDSVASVLESLRARSAANEKYMAKVADGEFSNAWVDGILERDGVTAGH
jgi:RraA family protein